MELTRVDTEYAYGRCAYKNKDGRVCKNTVKFSVDGSVGTCPACGTVYLCDHDQAKRVGYVYHETDDEYDKGYPVSDTSDVAKKKGKMKTLSQVKEKLGEIVELYLNQYRIAEEDGIKKQAEFFLRNESHIKDCFTETSWHVAQSFTPEEIEKYDGIFAEHGGLQGFLENMIVKEVLTTKGV